MKPFYKSAILIYKHKQYIQYNLIYTKKNVKYIYLYFYLNAYKSDWKFIYCINSGEGRKLGSEIKGSIYV